jgi:glycosyltransferase involved in cell wall biosynthesis
MASRKYPTPRILPDRIPRPAAGIPSRRDVVAARARRIVHPSGKASQKNLRHHRPLMVGVSTFARPTHFRRLVQSLLENTDSGDLGLIELVVSDDGSPPSEAAEVDRECARYHRETGKPVILLRKPNRGRCAARSRILWAFANRSRHPHLLMVDDDTVFCGLDWLRYCLEAFQGRGICCEAPYVVGEWPPRSPASVLSGWERDIVGHSGPGILLRRPNLGMLMASRDVVAKSGYMDVVDGDQSLSCLSWARRALVAAGGGKFWPARASFGKYLAVFRDSAETWRGKGSAEEISQPFVHGPEERSLREAWESAVKRPAEAARIPGRPIPKAGKAPPAGISVVIPVRGEDRAASVAAVIKAWRSQEASLEIVVVEQDTLPRLQGVLGPLANRYLHCYSDLSFNRSWAFNCGVREASGEIVVLHDGDLVPSADYAVRCASGLSSLDAWWPWWDIRYLDEGSTSEFPGGPRSIKAVKVNSSVSGGSVAVRREWFMSIGGMCEDCWGWGAEDDIFREVAFRLGRARKATQRDGCTLWHLWHPRTPYDNAEWSQNASMLSSYIQATASRIRTLNGNWPRKGRMDKLRRTSASVRSIPRTDSSQRWLHVVYDADGWAYHHRAKALAKHCPEGWRVTMSRGVPHRRELTKDSPDVVLCLPYGQAGKWRRWVEDRGRGLLVVGYNVGWPRRLDMLSRLIGIADWVLFNNEEAWNKAGGHPQTYTISNGVDLDIFRPGLSQRKRKVLAVVSKFHKSLKGWDDILVPLKKTLSGEGIECDFRLVDSSRAPMTPSQMASWYCTGQVLVVASKSEGTPNPMLEAAACGCAIVTTSVGNVPEIIRDGRNGIVVSKRDVPSFHRAILRAIDSHKAMAAEISGDIQAWSWRLRAEEYFGFLEAVCEGRHPNPPRIRTPAIAERLRQAGSPEGSIQISAG